MAWTHEYKGGRVFYTSMGLPRDFTEPNFRQLLINAVEWTTGRMLSDRVKVAP